MDSELKLMASYVSKLKFILQKDQQQEPHTANLLVLLGSSNQDKTNGLSGGENRMDTRTRKKPRRYQLLTMQQKEKLNHAFQSCPNPDSNVLNELANELNMTETQVKYWFQNRRTQMKKFKNNEEHKLLQKENEELKKENAELRNRMKNSTCHACDLPLFHIDCHHWENPMLKGENKGNHGVTNNIIPQAVSSLLPSSSGLVASGSNLSSNPVLMPVSVMPSSVLQSAPAVSGANFPILHNLSASANDGYVERYIFLDLANRAMEEFFSLMKENESLLVKKMENGPLWLPHMDILGVESLNYQEYLAKSRTIGQKPVDFKVVVTRDTAIVNGSCVDLVKSLSDANRWRELFPGIVASANTTKIISTGPSNLHNGLLQLMRAELQVMSPEVPVCDVTFLRQSVQFGSGLWCVVDVSIDTVLPGESKTAQPSVQTSSTAARRMEVRLLPSGCVIEEMKNGYSKVTWMVHAAYDERAVPVLYQSLLRSAKALGACRWVASLQRHSQFLSGLHKYIFRPDSTKVVMRRKVLYLVKQMTSSFTGLFASLSKASLQDGDDTHFAHQMVGGTTGEPAGLLLSATTTIWLPGVNPRRVYDHLRDEQCLGEWRCLLGEQLHQGNPLPYGAPLNGETMSEFYRMVNGLHEGHAISLMSPREMGGNISNTLLLQEARTDLSGSLIVYARTDVNTVHSIMNSNLNPATVFLVSSGCAILPDCLESFPLRPAATADQASNSSAAIASRSETGGSFVTVTYQMFFSSQGGAAPASSSVHQGRDALKNATDMFKAALDTLNPA
uniref:Homeobox domain-containing protein n=1 Tax=Oryza punctata TaxID=4537 RepID=A0A0E0LTE0_ORYPU